MKDIKGLRTGNLLVEERVGLNKWGNVIWKCKCDCGNFKNYPSGKIVSGRVTNCGCKTKELKQIVSSKHGITTGGKPRTLNVWCDMKARCFNPKSVSYKNYGGRGITVSNEWLGEHGFENFHNWCMENGYFDSCQIDRIDNDGNYEPLNCRLVTRKENARNTRKNRHVILFGKDMLVCEILETYRISKTTLYRYLKVGDFALENYIFRKGC